MEDGPGVKILIRSDPQVVVRAVLALLMRHHAIALIFLQVHDVACPWRSESHVDGLLLVIRRHHAIMGLTVLGEVQLGDFRLRFPAWRKWL